MEESERHSPSMAAVAVATRPHETRPTISRRPTPATCRAFQIAGLGHANELGVSPLIH